MIEFGEHQELLESLSNPPAKKAKMATEHDTQENKKGGKPYRAKSSAEACKKHKPNTKRNSKEPWCKLHGPGHWTDDCKVVKQQIENMKSQWSAQHKSSYGKSNGAKYSSNKNPKKRGYYTKEEVNEMIQQKISKQVKDSRDSESDTEKSLYNFEK